MKILLVTAHFSPEPFTITSIAKELKSRGNDITVITGVPNYGQFHIYPGYEHVRFQEIEGIKVYRVNEKVRTPGIYGLFRNYMSVLVEFKKLLKNLHEEFDIVFSHVMSPIFSIDYVGTYCKKHKIPHFHYGFDLWPESLVSAGYFSKYSPFVHIFKLYCAKKYRSCDALAFASPSTEAYFKDYLKVNVPFKHIYQPCLSKLPEMDFVSNHTYKEDGKLHILFCGTLARFNHIDILFKALIKLKDKVDMTIVGSGSMEDYLKEFANTNDLSDVVTFVGRIRPKETPEYYQKADILYVPLFWNCASSNMIPQKLIEYLMYARPILGMIKGDGAEILKEASDKNVVSDQTPNALYDSLLFLLDKDNSYLNECGLENRKYFESKKEFRIGPICDQIEDCMLDLIKNNKYKV